MIRGYFTGHPIQDTPVSIGHHCLSGNTPILLECHTRDNFVSIGYQGCLSGDTHFISNAPTHWDTLVSMR